MSHKERLRRTARLVLVAWAFGCGSAARPTATGALPNLPDVKLELVYAALTASGRVEVGGFDGSVGPGEVVEMGGIEAVADSRGRFRGLVDGAEGDLLAVKFPESTWTYRVREPRAAISLIAQPALEGGAGDVPNDLRFLSNSEAILVRSGDDAISVFDPDVGIESGMGIRLPHEIQPANPFYATPLDARRVAVTSFVRGRVYIIDRVNGVVERVLTPPQVDLSRPFMLSRPADIDDDGADDSFATRFVPRAPQAAFSSSGKLIVGFTGFTEAGTSADRRAVWLPGVVVTWAIDALDRPPSYAITPAMNPQEITGYPSGHVLVTMSGTIDFLAGGPASTSSGSVAVLDLESMQFGQRWSLGDFAPTSSMFKSDTVWVSSAIRPRILGLGSDGGIKHDLFLNSDSVDSVFRLVEIAGGLIGAASFNTDKMHIIDPGNGALNPMPFVVPIEIGPGRPANDGLQLIARRPGRAGVDFVGADMLALMRASKLVPLDFRQILGP